MGTRMDFESFKIADITDEIETFFRTKYHVEGIVYVNLVYKAVDFYELEEKQLELRKKLMLLESYEKI